MNRPVQDASGHSLGAPTPFRPRRPARTPCPSPQASQAASPGLVILQADRRICCLVLQRQRASHIKPEIGIARLLPACFIESSRRLPPHAPDFKGSIVRFSRNAQISCPV